MQYYTGILIGRTRRERGIEQRDLAQKLGVSAPALSQWERGERPFPVERVADTAEALGVPPDALTLDIPVVGEGRRARLRPPFPPGATLEQAATLGRHEWDLHATLLRNLPDNQYRLLRDDFPRQTQYELVTAMKLCAFNAKLVLTATGSWKCPVVTMHDHDSSPADHLLQPVIMWEKSQDRLVVFGQTPLNVPGHDPIRPDFLICYQRHRQRAYWLTVEIDDRSSHDEKQVRDQVRAQRLVLPILRYENQTVLKPWFFPRLLEDIRNLSPEVARRRLQQIQRARRIEEERRLDAERRRSVA